MYTIRVDPGRKLLTIVASGRMDTEEALQALSHALTLSAADGIRAAICFVDELQHGPGSLLHVAAALAFGYRPGMRVAFVAGERQLSVTERFARFTGQRDGVRVFTLPGAAEAWLTTALAPAAHGVDAPSPVRANEGRARRVGAADSRTRRASEPAA